MHATRLVAAILLLASNCVAGEVSLCTSAEQAAFSCSTGKKSVSLCSSSGAGAARSHLRYAFGRPGAIELSYPSSNSSLPPKFYVGSIMYSQGSTSYLRFLAGSYEYIIYPNQGRAEERGWLKEGLVIAKNNHHVAHYRCQQSNPPRSNWRSHADGANESTTSLANEGTEELERVENTLLQVPD